MKKTYRVFFERSMFLKTCQANLLVLFFLSRQVFFIKKIPQSSDIFSVIFPIVLKANNRELQ